MVNPNRDDEDDIKSNHWSINDDDDDQEDQDEEDGEDAPKSKKKVTDSDEDEGDNDDQDDDEEEDEDEGDDATIPLKKYKELQKASTKGTQNLIQVNKAYKLAMSKLTEIADDPKALLALHKENPDSAQVVLDTYYKGININQFRKDVLKENIQNEEIDEDKLEKMYEKMVAKKEAEKEARITTKRLDTMLGELDPKTAKKVRAEYEDITDGRQVSPDKVKKFFKMAYYEAVGEKLADDKETSYLKQSSPSQTKSGGKGSSFRTKEQTAMDESVSFLEEMGVLKKKAK